MIGMNNLTQKLLEELNTETVFTIPLFGGIPVDEGVVVSWIVMAVLLVLCLILTRNLKVENPSKRQLAIETAFVKLQDMFDNMLGENAKQYTPLMATLLLFIGLSNIFGIFGFKAPTKDLNVTVGLAVIAIVLIEVAGFRQKGPKKWLKSFSEPVAIVTPINILELFIRPLSLCMRLFGNVLGAFVIMKLIENLIPVVVPMIFSLYFDFFDGFIQAYVFVFLTSLFIKEATE